MSINILQKEREYVENRKKAVADIVEQLMKGMEYRLNAATKTCLNCTHFIEHTELCKLASARPPARVIALGCSSHDDEVPF